MVARSWIVISLVSYIQRLHSGDNTRECFDYHAEELAVCNPLEVNIAVDNLLSRANSVASAELSIARFIRAAGKGIDSWNSANSTQLKGLPFRLAKQNDHITAAADSARHAFSSWYGAQSGPSPENSGQKELTTALNELRFAREHYILMQNELFSRIEKSSHPMFCTGLMWHLQDTVASLITNVINGLQSKSVDPTAVNRLFGRLFVLVQTLIYREQNIMYPVVQELFPETGLENRGS